MKFEHFQKMVQEVFQREERDISPATIDVKQIHPAVLAFLGDAYYHLYIRTRLLAYEVNKVQILNFYSAQFVSASYQAKVYREIAPSLTDEERDIYRRGRNTKTHAPRKATAGDYHSSTGFEALLGTLYLMGKVERLEEIAELAFQSAVSFIKTEAQDIQ